MAQDRKRKIAIIGHDSTHVSAFTKRLFEDEDLSSKWEVSSIYRDLESEMKLSISRRETIEEALKDYPITWYDSLENLENHDAFMVLTVDARMHLKWLKRLAPYHKPVFVDKPLVYDDRECLEILELEKAGLPIFSSSALYYSPFVKRLRDTINESTRKIVIEGPMYLEKEVPPFHWYGIHLVTILQRLVGIDLDLQSFEEQANYYRIAFDAKGIECVIHAYPKDKHDFTAMVMNREGLFADTIENDHRPLYDYLLEEVLRFFDHQKADIQLEDTCKMMRCLSQLNDHMK